MTAILTRHLPEPLPAKELSLESPNDVLPTRARHQDLTGFQKDATLHSIAPDAWRRRPTATCRSLGLAQM